MKLYISMTNVAVITIAEIVIKKSSAVNAGFYKEEKNSGHVASYVFEFSSPLTRL